MSVEILILLALGVCVVCWYLRRSKPPVPRTPPFPPALVQLPAVPTPHPLSDPFLEQVRAEKARTEAAVKAQTREHREQLDERFAADVELKSRLSQFARSTELDKALIALWEEIRYYPSWSKRDDFQKWNKLHMTGLIGSEGDEVKSVEFVYDGQRFKVSERTWSGMEGEPYADFNFYEGDDEVFAIRCSAEYKEYGTDYQCFDVAALKKRGNWAKVLLHFYGQIQVQRNKTSEELKYFRAEEIKSRFEE